MNLADLNKVALAMVAPGKGILAADESSGTIKKRFDAIGVPSTEETRRDYREMLFRSRDAMTQTISGVILYDETIWQNAADGTPLIKIIEQSGAVVGIKVDEGTQILAELPERTGHRRFGQARRAPEKLLRARRTVCKMAGRDRCKSASPDNDRDPRQCSRAGALCRIMPGGPDRSDRRAGSADGWRS